MQSLYFKLCNALSLHGLAFVFSVGELMLWESRRVSGVEWGGVVWNGVAIVGSSLAIK